MVTIGTKIKELRKAHGYTLQVLSSKADISVSFLSDIENDRSNPSLERLKDLAAVLNVSVSEILQEPSVQKKDSKKEKSINKMIDDLRKDLSSNDGLMFNGEPASEDAIDSLLSAIRVGLEIANEKNKKYTPKKYF